MAKPTRTSKEPVTKGENRRVAKKKRSMVAAAHGKKGGKRSTSGARRAERGEI